MSDEIRELLLRLTEKDWTKRRVVVTRLAQAGDAAVAGLCEILQNQRDDETRLASAVEALVASAGNPDPVLIRLADSSAPPPVVCDAVVVLGRRRHLRAGKVLEKLALAEDGNVSLAAIEALGRIGGSVGVKTLIEVAQKRDFFRTFPAIEVLGKSGDERAVKVLTELLQDPLYAQSAAHALSETGDTRAFDALLQMLVSGDEALVTACAVALAHLAAQNRERVERAAQKLTSDGATLVEKLRLALANAQGRERAAICTLLAWTGGDAATALLLAIARDDASSVPVDALRALGRKADAPLIALLPKATSQQRALWLPLLGGAPNGISAIVACLKDPVVDVRLCAADALARIGDVTAVPALFEALHDEQSVQAATGAIQSLGSNETEALALKAAEDKTPHVRRAALRIISYFGYAGGTEALLRAVEGDDDRARQIALAGLPFIEDARAHAMLFQATHHASPNTRAAAVRALSQLSVTPEVERALAVALSDTDAWVRYYASQSMGRLLVFSLVDKVITLLEDPAGQVRVAAIEALSHFHDERSRAALERAANASELDVRRAAIVGLGASGSEDALKILLAQANAEDSAARLMALSSLANYGGAQVVQSLRRAVFDADAIVRQGAIALLAARRDESSFQTLIDLVDRRELLDSVSLALAAHIEHLPRIVLALDTANQEKSVALVNVLLRYRRKEAENALIEVLRVPNVYARRAAASALGGVRSAAAKSALERAANDEDAEVRARARAAV